MSKPQTQALAIAIAARVPVILWGKPGAGKTSTIVQMGESAGLPTEVVIASIRDPTDFGGLPVIRSEGDVRLAAPAWAKRLADSGRGLLFLDEVNTAPPAVQAALLRVVLDRTVGELVLPKEVSVVAAANPTEESAGGWDLSPPLANRFCHIDFEPLTAAEWAEALVLNRWPKSPPIPRGLSEMEVDSSLRALIGGFLQARPKFLCALPKSEADASRAWPSPRSWEMMTRLLTVARASGADFDVQALLVNGCVGAGVGAEFLSFLREADLPDPEVLLKDPSKYKHPKRGDLAFAVLTSVVEAVVGPNERSPEKIPFGRIVAAWNILAQAAEEGSADIGAVACKRLARVTNLDKQKAADKAAVEKSVSAYLPVLKAAGLVVKG